MKTKLLLIVALLLTSHLSFLESQIPQGFNYQAIARDATGAVIADQSLPVRITIQTSSTGGTVIWDEQHTSVTTNQFGLISLVVGQGSKLGGTAASFSGIDWSAQTLYIIRDRAGRSWGPHSYGRYHIRWWQRMLRAR